MKKILPLLFGLILILSACSQSSTESEPVGAASPSPASATEAQLLSTASPEETPSTTNPGGRQAIFPQTILVFVKEGKFPGSPLQWTVYPTGRVLASSGQEWMLDRDQVAPIFDQISTPAFISLGLQYGSPETCRDCTAYTLYIYGPGEVQKIQVYSDGSQLPAELQVVLERLEILTSKL